MMTPRLPDKDIPKPNPTKFERHSVETLHFLNVRLFCVHMRKHDLTLLFVDHHHTTQQRGEGQCEEGGV